ncbi:probable WSS1 Protein involved in sister chromatid separation and segregation [Rhynchosporium agropyri]|uniref:Probable WSS1 Protein involved in sister chromatid separation and segregation n=1 Tax=Rhynchosporium agropyri TaxID=914238 RepID=A0A1E1LFW7_9HELO|nr:probable WSS1 Protein involved in sister chromatid separation and segregation [Rhynchosporium agropyri]
MAEHDALILQYSHLAQLPREKEALHSIKKIASLVKPLMRARGWTVGTLAEFYPDQQNLLGINQNRGQKICLRLRYPHDKTQFLPMEQVVDTMLHELSHNVHGPHDAKFHALWDQLRKEYEGLLSKGYTGEGFLSDGHKLGGRRVPRDEARRIARNAAETRRTLSSGSGQKLGGRPVPAGTDIRSVIVSAIERRNTVLKGCGSGNKDDDEIQILADTATQNGFKTKAEEDEANDRAIAQALWDLVQEDQKKEYGNLYIPPTPINPTGNGGGDVGPPTATAIKREAPFSPVKSNARAPPVRQHSDRPVSRLVAQGSSKPKSKLLSSRAATAPAPAPMRSQAPASIQSPDPSSLAHAPSGWTCPVCTLHNPISFLACDACTSQRPVILTQQLGATQRQKDSVSTTQHPGLQTQTWTCSQCTTIMEQKWWTCSTCGKLKDSS